MNISDEAVEAAAKKLYWMGPSAQKVEWEDVGDGIHGHYRYFARAALEAAAPHLMEVAWERGREDGYHHRPNPYRSAGAGE